MRILELSNHPVDYVDTPPQRGTLPRGGTRAKFPSAEGWAEPGVVYSMAQAWSNTYEPVLSLYVVFAGAYIIHDPPGVDAIQLVAVPADV